MKRRILIGLGGIPIVLIALYSVIFYTNVFPKNPIPESQRNDLHFTTYYPGSLPEGYAIKDKSFAATQGILTFIITRDDGVKITVSQQHSPENFDFEEFHKNALANKRATVTDHGRQPVHLGRLEANHIASIQDSSTWVLISGSREKLSLNDLETLAKTFRK